MSNTGWTICCSVQCKQCYLILLQKGGLVIFFEYLVEALCVFVYRNSIQDSFRLDVMKSSISSGYA